MYPYLILGVVYVHCFVLQMAPVIERVYEGCVLGEGPHWDVKTQSLYYVDVFNDYICKYTPSTNINTKTSIGANASFIIPVNGKSDQFVIGCEHQIRLITWDGVSETISKFETISQLSTPESEIYKFNDGKCDATGKLWVGTIDREIISKMANSSKGSLYSLDKNKRLKSHVSNIIISNGLAWSPDSKRFYYVDSGARMIDQFEFDAVGGEVKNRKTLFTFSKHNIEGFPDGQAIDAEGNLWVAVFNSSVVIKIDTHNPETILETIQLPAKQVTSVAFGGSNLDELYVTTGRVPRFGGELHPPEHGALYKITKLGVKGLPGVSCKI